MRLYLNNDSYPEMRGIRPHWPRTMLWWRAIARATRTARFWLFAATQLVVLAATLVVNALIFPTGGTADWGVWATHIGVLLAGLLGFAYLQVSWGGDMMRSYLRAVSDKARYACPCCGQSLLGHPDAGCSVVQCPECATHVDPDVCSPPYRIPREFRVFPPWRSGGPR